MIDSNRDKLNNFFIITIYSIVFVAIFLMSSLFPYVNDDIGYADGVHTSNLIDALGIATNKISNVYFNWSGRIVGNFFAFLMVIIDKSVYNVCNALMHVLLGRVMYLFVSPKRKSPLLLIFIYLSIWLFTPEYGMVLIWTNATTIYMWAQLPLLVFALIYYRTLTESERKNTTKLKVATYSAGMILLGVLAGNSMEPTAATMAVVGFFWLIWCFKTKRGVRVWEITGIIGFFIGFATSVLSPGNAARAAVVREMVGKQNPIKDILIRIIRETYYTAKFMPVVIGASIALWLVACALDVSKGSLIPVGDAGIRSKIKILVKLRWKEPIFVAAAIMSIYMMTFSIAFALRIFLAPTILLIISMAISLNDIADRMLSLSDERMIGMVKSIVCVLVLFVGIFVATQYITAMIEMYQSGEPFVKTTIFVEYNQNLFG